MMDQSQKQAAAPPTRLFISSVIEPKDPDEERMERGNAAYINTIKGLSDREANDALNAFVSKGAGQHKDIQLGLIYNVLTEPSLAAKCFQDMILVSRDGLATAVAVVMKLASDKWLRLSETARVQLLWVTRELVKSGITCSDELYLWLLKQIVGGDTSPKNIWLAETLLDIFVDHKAFLEKSSPRDMCSIVVYTYLRLIVDHRDSSFSLLRQREVDLCVMVLREKWAEVMYIGRDLVRLLQMVGRIPEFEKLWRDIFLNPSVLSPNFTGGIAQLMGYPSKKHILASRLTPDMERKMYFLLMSVQFGKHSRYQEWFQRQFLSTPESQTLRCDLIRYICVCIHPNNEQIQKNVPRWFVIGWLLMTCTSSVAASDCKLALFLDWLFFNKSTDTIMNIEPAILVMFNSIKQHPAITATLLDFLCRVINQFCPRYITQIREGVYRSLKEIEERNVLVMCQPPAKNFWPLFNNPKLDKELRALVQQNFQEFCNPEPDVKEEIIAAPRDRLSSIDNGNHIGDGLAEGSFSDDDDDLPPGKATEEVIIPSVLEPSTEKEVDMTEALNQLTADMKELVNEIHAETEDVRCDLTDRLMNMIIQEEDFDQEMASNLATCLCNIFGLHRNNRLLPQEVDDESIEDSITKPLFVIFRALTEMTKDDQRTKPLLQLMGEMYEKEKRLGYHLLYFLKVSKVSDEKMQTYTQFCKSMDDEKSEKDFLLDDMRTCVEDDIRLFTFLIPDIYTHFSSIVVGNTELVHMIVENIDSTQLQELVSQILQGHLTMVTQKDNFLTILRESLKWETIEQYFLWQLFTAHNISVEHMVAVLPLLEYSKNAEAMTSLMVQLKQSAPSPDLLRPVLCRECKKHDLFVVSLLKFWAQTHEEDLSAYICQLLMGQNGVTNSSKNKRSKSKDSKKEMPPTVDQVLTHLDHMRQVCRNISFLNNESIQAALQHVQLKGTHHQKSTFTDLLALAVDPQEDQRKQRVLRGRRGVSNSSPKSAKTKRPVQDESDSSSSSEDEELVSRQPPKKKKKISPVQLDDDSD